MIVILVHFLDFLGNFVFVRVRHVSTRMTNVSVTEFAVRTARDLAMWFATHISLGSTTRLGNVLLPIVKTFLYITCRDGTTLKVGLKANVGGCGDFVGVCQTVVSVRATHYIARP
jgi:hypothetical protein